MNGELRSTQVNLLGCDALHAYISIIRGEFYRKSLPSPGQEPERRPPYAAAADEGVGLMRGEAWLRREPPSQKTEWQDADLLG